MKRPLAICCGDPAGVGPEVIETWHRSRRRGPRIRLYGPASWLERFSGVEGVAVGPGDYRAVAGKPDVAGAQVALEAMTAAADSCIQGSCRGVVTGPVSKLWLQRVGFCFPGQTEFFADRWKGVPTMGFVGEQLSVVLATWHVPLEAVPRMLAKEPHHLENAVRRAHLLGKVLNPVLEPRIAVCGLNPHAGEGGILGMEEEAILNPLLEGLRGDFANLSPCLPADTVFWRARRGEFDVVVALYHDQGLAPLKTVDFDTAVNVTLGLPFVRTSPDHGTGFDIAGRGLASFSSFGRAVELADRLADDACAGR